MCIMCYVMAVIQVTIVLLQFAAAAFLHFAFGMCDSVEPLRKFCMQESYVCTVHAAKEFQLLWKHSSTQFTCQNESEF